MSDELNAFADSVAGVVDTCMSWAAERTTYNADSSRAASDSRDSQDRTKSNV